LLAFVSLGCERAPGSGVAALLQVRGATYADGALAALADQGGPAVVDTYARTSWVTPGETGKILDGSLAAGATAVLLALDGDQGYWVLPASAPDTQTPDRPTFEAVLGFSAAIPSTELQLRLVAADVAGKLGPATVVPLSVLPAQPPAGALVVVLDWDSDADLDLHVVDPSGTEIWSGNIASAATDGGSSPGFLDFDSNANCTIDGRRMESVAWAMPPSGHYVVRVGDFSLCGAAAAHWNVRAIVDGSPSLRSTGVATAADARFAKGPGSGVLALEFDWSGGG
jgi:hypothetical protein